MSNNWANLSDWLMTEEDVLASAPDPLAGGPPANSQPPGLSGGGAPAAPLQQPDATTNPMNAPVPDMGKPSVSDPVSPDMPEEKEDMDYEQWKNKFFKESIKGDVNQLIDMIQSIRNSDLDTYPRKFVEDNLQILFLRQNANIDKASQAIRKSVREQLDQNNPSTSLIQNIFNALQGMPELTNIFIKMLGLFSNKSDLHRKYCGALLGAVQVGSGGQNEDLIFNQREYSIKISTRFNSKFGLIDIGKWCMVQDDPERYLSDSEVQRLQEGSPEEREVLRKRVMIESIADNYKKRAYIVNVVAQDGTVFFIGLDLSNALRDAYTKGKLIIKTSQNENSEAMYDMEGNMVVLEDIKIMYEKDTGKLDDEGKPLMQEMEFISRKDGILFVTATLETLKEAASSFQGMIVKEIPYAGNPSDIQSLVRCVPSSTEILLRNCA
jgi:hypothetical protein